MKTASQPTLSDVARASGVSLATVSRVLSGSGYAVSEATRGKVLAAARALHYMPNALGKNLKTRRSHAVGAVLPNITNPYYAQLFQGIGDAAMKRDWRVLLCNAHRSARLEERSIEMLLSERVEGLLLASISAETGAVRRAVEMGCAVITLEQELPLPCDHVGFDYRAGARMATGHLIGLGHTRVGFTGAPLDRFSRAAMLEGYRAAMASHGLPVREDWVWLGAAEADTAGVYEIENGRACARRFAAMDGRPTACVCLNDMTAMGLIRGLIEQGLRVPEDVSVIGFDNIPVGELCVPPLTTIDQRAARLGQLAFERLIERVEGGGDEPPRAVRLEPELILRASTARCPE